MDVHNQKSGPIQGGTVTLVTEGYGCAWFICMWQDGPTVTQATCTFNGIQCVDGNLLTSNEKKMLTVDFHEAIETAKNTDGCCEVDSSCGCMIRGTATMSNVGDGEYAKVTMAFSCNFKEKNKPTTCKV